MERREGPAGQGDDDLAILIAQLVGRFESCTDFCRNVRGGRLHHLFGVRHSLKWHVVEQCRAQGQQHGDLGRHRHRRILCLLETGADASAMLDARDCIRIEARTEAREGFELLELRVGKFEVAGYRTVGCPLRLAADARY